MTPEEIRAEIEREGRTGVILPPVPKGFEQGRRWLRHAHDLFAEGLLTREQLQEARRTLASVGESHRAEAEVRKADAAIETAHASTKMAETLAAFEHGGPAVAMLARLTESAGTRRRLPARVVPSDEAAS